MSARLGAIAVLLVVVGIAVSVGWNIAKIVWAAGSPQTYDPALVHVIDVTLSCVTWPYAFLIAGLAIVAAMFRGT